MINKTLNKNDKPTVEQLKEIEQAYTLPPVFDEDSPEIKGDLMQAMKRATLERNKTKIDNLPNDVIAWDPDFTKLTTQEKEILDKSDEEMKNGDYISEEDFWK